MTVTTTTSRVDVQGNGSATVFSFAPVVIFEASDLIVTVADSAGNETVISPGGGATNYSLGTITYPGTGSITYPASGGPPLPTGSKITIKRVIPLLQSVALSNQGAYFPQVQEQEFDYLTSIDQQQQEQIGRALLLPATDAITNMELPSQAERAGNFLGFDSTGAFLVASQVSGAPVSPAMQPVLAASTTAAAMTALGINPVMQPFVEANSLFNALVLLQYQNGKTGQTTRPLNLKLGDNLCSADFAGVDPTGATDSYAGLQAAINAAGAGRLFVPKGNYKTSVPLQCNTSGFTLVGEGRDATIFNPTFASGDVFQIGNGTNNPGYVTLDSFGIICSAVTRTGGSGVKSINSHDIRITNFVSYYDWIGVTLDGGANEFECTLDNFEINASKSVGIQVGPTLVVQDAWIERGVVSGAPIGIEYNWLSGGHLSRIDVINATTAAIDITPGAGQLVTALFCFDVAADTTSAGSGWIFGGTGQISNILLSACWGASNHVHGFQFSNTSTNGVTLTGCIAQNNMQHGISIGAGTGIMVTGGSQVYCNSAAGTGLYDGIAVGNGVTGWSITDNFCGLGGSISFLTGNAQAYGIFIGTGCSSYVVKGNLVLNNSTGAINDNSRTGVVQDNPGYKTRSAGQAKIANGTTVVAVTHGLAATPTAGDIMITPASDWTSAGRWWIGTVGATTFNINCAVNPGADFFFNWVAAMDTP